MHYCLMFFLVGWVTLGIGWLVWYHRVSGRIGEEQAARGLPVTVTASTFWLWASSARSSQWDRSSIYTSCCTR